MEIVLLIISFIIAAWVLLKFPWIAISFLMMVPLIKPAAYTYMPFFRIVDITVFTNILVGMLGIWAYMRTRGKSQKLLLPWSLFFCLGLIACIFVVGQFWTTAPVYGSLKTQRMIGIGLPFLMLPALFIRSNQSALGVLYILTWVSGFVAAVLLFGPDISLHAERYGTHYGRKTFLGSDANTPAVVIMVGILVVLLGLISKTAPKWMKLYSLVLIPMGVAAILVSGSRANLLGLCSSLLFVPFLTRGGVSKNIIQISVIVSLVIAALVFLLPALNIDIPLSRWLGFADQLAEGDLTSTRTPAWVFCFTEAWDGYIIFGHGAGSYAMDFLGQDAPVYPHNIILEALYEAGIIGALAIMAFFWICYSLSRRGMKIARTPQERFIVAAPGAIVLAMSVTALTHWNLDSARILYLFAGILAVTVTGLARQVKHDQKMKSN